MIVFENNQFKKNNKETNPPMQNITINIPEIYDENIQYLKGKGLVSSRSQAVRIALKEYLEEEYETILPLLKCKSK